MPELGEPLSDRELDVLRGLAAGAANKDIADDLSISPLTVKTHLRNIYTKLGVSTRTEAMTVAMQKGLVVVPGATAVEDSRDGQLVPVLVAGGDSPLAPEKADEVLAGPSHRWRNLSLALLALLLVAAGLVFIQWRSGGQEVAATPPFEEQPIGDSRWLASRPLPEARSGQALAAFGLEVYLIGGEVESGVVNDVLVFDSRDRSWRQVTEKPMAVTGTMADELFGEIYVPGGLQADKQPTDVVEVYSPTQDAWRRTAPLPQPIAGALVVAEGGYLYVFGGWNGQTVLDTAYVYDPAADSWRPLAAMPQPRTGAAGDALTGRIYVVGGSNGREDQQSCYTYIPANDTWDTCPDLLQPRTGAGATVLLNKLYVIGGSSEVEPGSVHGELFDPNTAAWTVLSLPQEAVPWLQPGVTHIENRIYAMGGQQANGLSDANLVYSPFIYQTFIPAAPSDSDE